MKEIENQKQETNEGKQNKRERRFEVCRNCELKLL